MDSPGANEYVEELVQRYERALLAGGFTDFDLQIKWAMQLIEQQPYIRQALEAKYPWLLIDEYQDLGLPLHRIVKTLTANTSIKLFAIGDPNQCIYDFAGANPRYLRELASQVNQYGQPIYLARNYRSCSMIINASSTVASSSVQFEAMREGDGYVECLTESAQQPVVPDIIRQLHHQEGIPYHGIMVLQRRRQDCKRIISQLEQCAQDIPCFKAADQIYDPRKPLIDWIERLVLYSILDRSDNSLKFSDLCEFWRTLLISNGLSNREASSIHQKIRLLDTLFEALRYQGSMHDWLQGVSERLGLEYLLQSYQLLRPDDVEEYRILQEALAPGGELADCSLPDMRERIQQEDRVFVDTLHSSKGKESIAVIIACAETLNTMEPSQQRANRRLFYVGMTRARDWLYIVHNGRSYLANQVDSTLRQLRN